MSRRTWLTQTKLTEAQIERRHKTLNKIYSNVTSGFNDKAKLACVRYRLREMEADGMPVIDAPYPDEAPVDLLTAEDRVNQIKQVLISDTLSDDDKLGQIIDILDGYNDASADDTAPDDSQDTPQDSGNGGNMAESYFPTGRAFQRSIGAKPKGSSLMESHTGNGMSDGARRLMRMLK